MITELENELELRPASARSVAFIAEVGELEDLAGLSKHARVALDLEADSFHRYFEKVCLIQISSPCEDYLFDPLALGMADPLRRLLEDPARTIVAHGADFDVLSLRRDFDLELGGLFDTMIAARLLGRRQLGLKALLESELGVEITKSEQRSDWAERPLSAKQIEYARRDTMYLLPLAERLEDQLRQAGRLEWQREDSDDVRKRRWVQKTPDPAAFWKLAAPSISDREARALRAAFEWRDQDARAANTPPFRVLSNEGIAEVARIAVRDGVEAVVRLAGRRNMPKSRGRLSRVAEAIARGLVDTTTLPERPRGERPPRMEAAVERRRNTLRSIRDERAAALGLEPSVLLTAADLDHLAREPPDDLSALAAKVGSWRASELWDRLRVA